MTDEISIEFVDDLKDVTEADDDIQIEFVEPIRIKLENARQKFADELKYWQEKTYWKSLEQKENARGRVTILQKVLTELDIITDSLD